MYSCSESCYHCSYFRISQNTVKSCFLNIENLTSKRKYSLCFSLSCTLCRTAGGITLDYENFTIFRILIRTICKFTRKIKTIKCCFSSCKIPCFSCCFPCTLCKNRFSHIVFATEGFCSRKYVSCSVTTLSTAPLASLLPSFCLVCPSNCGSAILILIIAVRPSLISSPERLGSFSFNILLLLA